jgi:DNA-binding NtrC family response regulator
VKDILFVDDERDLLDSLRARLYKHRHDWNMKFVVSGDEAISAFEQQHVDLIVSDVRMPGMDGGQLLSVVKQRWPTAVRIIVSGYSDPVQAVRLTSLAHQYVAKPCDGLQLENIIERYLGFATIRNLVLSAEIFSQWKSPASLLNADPERLQNHASYLAGLNAPFDWQEAQRRVQASASPTTLSHDTT